MSEDAVLLPISHFHEGLTAGDPDLVLAALGSEFIMFNGNYSADPTAWQAHLFLTGQALEAWPEAFLREAGPYENQYEFSHTHVRGNAAIVVTRETGRNRFRSWQDEIVAWLLGRRDGEWRIVGYFIRDIRNPE